MPYDLPPEIEDQIFECAARVHPKHAPALSVISKRIQICVEKVIYERIHFFPSPFYLPWPRPAEVATMESFRPTLHQRPAQFFATHVRSVLFQSNVLYTSAKHVLEKCTGLENLLFLMTPRHPDVPDASPLIFPSAHTLQSLFATRVVLKDMASSGIVFPKLRYLYIDVWPYETRVPTLEWLPALHTVDLYLYNEPGFDDSWENDAKTVLSTTQNLQVLGLYTLEERDCPDHVERWKETVVMGPHENKTRVFRFYEVDGFLSNRWRRLSISVMDVLLEI
ncbi:hypothetical protein H2248_012133 [Termitomyces sp. 'cryptogamus']|nr:hypothetical protein H2248_012133 [Termitomyces sp. 'cryptogamus']